MEAIPIIPWIGGKRRLAKRIIPMFPDHTCYVEPFCGAAALFFLKRPADVEILNDINGELVNLYRVAKHHLEELVHQYNYMLISRQIYGWLQKTPPEVLTDVQRAARFYYLQKNAFGGKVDDQVFGTATTAPPKLRLADLKEELDRSWPRLSMAVIEYLSWEVCVDKYDRPHTLFFMDPPYWDTEGYGVEFGIEQYDAMAARLRSMEGKAIVTVNDHPEMRRAFDGLQMQSVPITYTVGGGSNAQAARELIIWNWKRKDVLPLFNQADDEGLLQD